MKTRSAQNRHIALNVTLNAGDKRIMDAIKPIVDGIAVFFGENREVLLHSFETLDRSVIHIRNGHITGRDSGAPVTDLGMKILNGSAGAGENVTGCYYSKTADGKNLRSVTIMIRNECNKPIGMMCINMNTSAPLIDVLNIFNGAGKRERALKISFIYGKINFPAGRKRRK